MSYYVYSSRTISGVDLKIINTSPNNIQLTSGQSVPGSGKLGMNGGFFEDVPPSHSGGPYVYSIAVNDNVPVHGLRWF